MQITIQVWCISYFLVIFHLKRTDSTQTEMKGEKSELQRCKTSITESPKAKQNKLIIMAV